MLGSKINPPKKAPTAAPMVLNIVASPTASEDDGISCLIAFVAAVKDMPNKMVGIINQEPSLIDLNKAISTKKKVNLSLSKISDIISKY